MKQAFQYAKATEKLKNVEFTVGQASNANRMEFNKKKQFTIKRGKDKNQKIKFILSLQTHMYF